MHGWEGCGGELDGMVVEATLNVFVKIECEVMNINWILMLCRYVNAFPFHTQFGVILPK